MTTTTRRRAGSRWWVPAGLLALSLVPAAAGALRTAELTAGAPVTEENARFFASPVPILAHIVGATLFLVLGAFQFVPSLRRHAWHRRAGRLTVLCGLIGGLAALWMTVRYPRPPLDGDLLTVFRLVFGTYLVVALGIGLLAIRRRDVVAHRAWVTRAYAIGVAAGTQAVFYGLWTGIAGPVGVTGKALLLGAAWVFNLVVAERIIRRGQR
jgi:hypothetical protein